MAVDTSNVTSRIRHDEPPTKEAVTPARSLHATIVLPCAGVGGRLAIPHPKELFPLGPGTVLLDRAFKLAEPAGDAVNFVVVVRSGKWQIAEYVASSRKSSSIAFVFQSPTGTGLYAAIRSALPWCQSKIIVLMPDEVVELEPTQPDPIGTILDALDRHPVAFLVATETDRNRLASEGALAVDREGHVRGYADKAGEGNPTLNAVWSGVAFRRTAAGPLLEVMESACEATPLTRSQLQRSRIDGSPAVRVARIHHLGTWPEIYTAMARRAMASRRPVQQ